MKYMTKSTCSKCVRVISFVKNWHLVSKHIIEYPSIKLIDGPWGVRIGQAETTIWPYSFENKIIILNTRKSTKGAYWHFVRVKALYIRVKDVWLYKISDQPLGIYSCLFDGSLWSSSCSWLWFIDDKSLLWIWSQRRSRGKTASWWHLGGQRFY